jgi:dihydroorotate dehydrogenase (NAD+) catalytic subunit
MIPTEGMDPVSSRSSSGSGFDNGQVLDGVPEAGSDSDEATLPRTISLGVDLGGVTFPTPVLAASGTFNSGKEMSGLIDLRKVGGIVTKSVTLAPTKGLPVPRMAETDSGMLNAIGLQNPGAEGFLNKDAPFIAAAGVPVIVSVAGRSVEEFAQVTMRIRDLPGVVAIEANISCPNVERRNQVFACHPGDASEVIGAMARLTTLPIFAKLTADVTNIVAVAEACVRAGAHGLSLINTLLGMAIDVNTFRPKLGAVTGGLSGPAIRPVAVRCIYQVAQALPDTPLIGIGGITRTEDAVELMLAGAWAVQVGTANFFDPAATIRIADGIGDFLALKGLTSPADLKAKVQLEARVPEPAYRSG